MNNDEILRSIEEQVRARLANNEDEFDISYDLNIASAGEVEAREHAKIQVNPLLNKTRFQFTIPNRIHIVIAGLGGTGGYVARDIGRLVREKSNQYETRITFIDPDEVEEKNLTRQNFIEDDIGWTKSSVLADRYSTAFGVEIGVIEEWCTENVLGGIRNNLRPNETMLVVGCIDNNKGRREIHNFVANNSRQRSSVLGWIDSGNESTSGQVILGCPNNYCSHYLPFVTDYYPELLDPTQDPVAREVSCAERALADIQNMFVNITAATHVLNFLNLIYAGNRSIIHGIEFSIKGANTPKFLEMNQNKTSIGADGIWNKRVQNVA